MINAYGAAGLGVPPEGSYELMRAASTLMTQPCGDAETVSAVMDSGDDLIVTICIVNRMVSKDHVQNIRKVLQLWQNHSDPEWFV